MTMTSSDSVMFRPASVVNKYAPYWEDDTVMNPVLVKAVEAPDGEFFHIQLPDGACKWVHCHTLGVFR
jgi:hypothetical protein